MGSIVFIARAVRSRPFVFMAALAMIAIGAVAGAYLKRPAYESSAKLLVNLESRGVSLSRAEVQYGGTMLQAVEVITSQVEILRSRKLVEATIDALGNEAFTEPPAANALIQTLRVLVERIDEEVEDLLSTLLLTERVSRRDKLVERVEKALRVYPVRQAQIIQVSFQWRNPRVPPVFLDRFLALYLDTVTGLNGRGEGPDLVDLQIRRAADDLDKAERERRTLDTTHGIVDLKREKQSVAERIDRLAGLLEGTSPGAAPPTSEGAAETTGPIAGSQITALRSQINGLQIERAKAAVGFTPDSRQLRELDGQIAAAEAALATGNREVKEALASHRARMRVLQSAEAAYDRVARNIEIASEAFQIYRKVAEDRRLQLAQETKLKIQVVDPPAMPIRPVGLSRLLLVAASVVFALVLATAFVGLIAMLERGRSARASASTDDADPIGKPVPFVGAVRTQVSQSRSAS